MKTSLTTLAAILGVAVTACGEPPPAAAPGSSAPAPPSSSSVSPSRPAPVAAGSASGALRGVRVASSGTQGEAGLYLAQAQGYFEQEGLNLDLSKSDQVQLPELLTGQVDVSYTPVSPGFYNAASRNVGLKIIAPAARGDADASGLFLNVRKDLIDRGKVTNFADLKGLKVAIPNDQLKYVLAKLSDAGGPELSELNVVTLSFDAMTTSFGNGSIDAGLMPEPLATAAAQKGLIAKWKSVGQIVPGEQQTVFVASSKFAANRELALKWVTAYLRGVRDYNDAFFKGQRRPQMVEILAKTVPVANPALYDKMSYTAMDPNGKVNVASLDDQMAWFVQAGLLEAPVDAAGLVDAKLAEQAVANLGPYR